jgi:hypothetical protein
LDHHGDVRGAAVEAGHRAPSPIGLPLRLAIAIILTLPPLLVQTWAN